MFLTNRSLIVYLFFLFSTKLSITVGSAKVVVSPNWSCSFAAIFLSILLIILPDLVFGKPGANWIKSGVAIGPICFLTHNFKSLSKSPEPLIPEFRVTKQYSPLPLISCGNPTTAASATFGCATNALSISAVPKLCPETIITSSTLPVIQ